MTQGVRFTFQISSTVLFMVSAFTADAFAMRRVTWRDCDRFLTDEMVHAAGVTINIYGENDLNGNKRQNEENDQPSFGDVVVIKDEIPPETDPMAPEMGQVPGPDGKPWTERPEMGFPDVEPRLQEIVPDKEISDDTPPIPVVIPEIMDEPRVRKPTPTSYVN